MKPPLFRCAASVAALALVLAGCASQNSSPRAAGQPALVPAPASLPVAKVATITIYRSDFDRDADVHPTVSVNGSDLVTPHRGTVFTARLLPGTYHFEVDGERAGDLKASAGQHYYFQMAIVPGGFSGHGRLGIVSPQQGQAESTGLQPSDKGDIENPAFR